ncbi:MAG: hypothetical protein MK135_00795 [Polyangiaceae bacterium]|nr:hypothetical protein [Polyangiaceae bacterium]
MSCFESAKVNRLSVCGAQFSRLLWGAALSLQVACASSATPTQTPEQPLVQESEASTSMTESEPVAEVAEEIGPLAIPTTCHGESEVCVPDPKWVRSLCEDVYPAVALYLFQKSAPFTHGYLTRKVRAVNASGGATSGDEWLRFDEEVVLLYSRSAGAGGMQVSGAEGGYDALRWDGSCVTLDHSEVRLQRPPQPVAAAVNWRAIGKDMQKSLKGNPAIKKAYLARKKECKGAFSGTVTKRCVQLDKKLNRVIVDTLEKGDVSVPEPKRRPAAD